ncbi:MAG: cytochrome c biogenesis protein CcsA [Bacteroidia bacterium]|nr:cytochrome c biogenesis protein CcsA [Bacteroidia bacterium]MDW8135011.1 cytochrome c biogenesis protein CcsA [Bacteroidia bacterium]
MRVVGVISTGTITAILVLAFFFPLPSIRGLGWTDRNLFFHVPMWFAMYALMGLSFFWSAKYLLREEPLRDMYAKEGAVIASFFGILGLLTGILWSRVTWAENLPDTDPQAWWGWDPKQTFALIALLMYSAYFALRKNIREERLRARLSAVYNIAATILVVPLTFFLPRYLGGLHPGAEGTPAFRAEDISFSHRWIFYGAVIGFVALGIWLWQIRVRMSKLEMELTTPPFPADENA